MKFFEIGKILSLVFCFCFFISCRAETKNVVNINENIPTKVKVAERTPVKESPQTRTKDKTEFSSDCNAAKKVNVQQENKKDVELLPNDKSVEGLNRTISNLVGDFIVDETQESVFEGDFNGDGCQDIALIVGATDAYRKIEDINDAASNTNIAVIKQNLRTGAKLMPQIRKENGNVFPTKMKSESSRALVIILGSKSGWNWKHGVEGKVFLLLDSVFTVKDCPDCHSELVPRNSQKQGSDCFPKNSKGNGIFTGGEEAGKLIYFDGKLFNWTQCGD